MSLGERLAGRDESSANEPGTIGNKEIKFEMKVLILFCLIEK